MDCVTEFATLNVYAFVPDANVGVRDPALTANPLNDASELGARVTATAYVFVVVPS